MLESAFTPKQNRLPPMPDSHRGKQAKIILQSIESSLDDKTLERFCKYALASITASWCQSILSIILSVLA